MGLFDFIRRPVQGAVDDTRGFLDGLMSPGIQATPQPMEDAPVGDVGQMRRPDVLTQKPSLLEGLGKYITSSDGLMALGAGLKGLSGDDNAGFEVAQMQRQRRADAEREAEKAQAKAEADAQKQKQQALNQAFWNAFDPDGKFNRAKYAENVKAVGTGYADPKDYLATVPQTGVSGDTAYERDPVNGGITWGEERPWSRRDQERADAADRGFDIRELLAAIAGRNAATNEYRAHKAPASGGGGAPIPRPTGRVF